MIGLLLQKQSDLSLHCLCKPFWQATSVRNFRMFAVRSLLSDSQFLVRHLAMN